MTSLITERVFHPYSTWEDFKWGMYDKTCYLDEQRLIHDAAMTLSTPGLLWEAMTYVTHHWKYATEQHLTNLSRNRQAWLGQAACCFVDGAPEYVTKLAWNTLTAEKQKEANGIADDVIQDWETKFLKGYFSWQKSS